MCFLNSVTKLRGLLNERILGHVDFRKSTTITKILQIESEKEMIPNFTTI